MLTRIFTILCFVTVMGCGHDNSSECEGDDTNQTDDTDSSGLSVTGVSVEIHSTVNTVLDVSWSLDGAMDEVWLRYTFENDEWYESPRKSGEVGTHQELILGIPQNTEVTFHVVASSGGEEIQSEPYEGLTGAIPSDFPLKKVDYYDASLASPHRWMLGVVDGGGYYVGPFWVFIMDRQGRIVWYHADIADNPIIAFPRISRDGRYIFFANRTPWSDSEGFVPSVVKMTLDSEYFERIDLPLSDNADMTDDGSILFNTLVYGGEESLLMEYQADGTLREIWDCIAHFGPPSNDCYSNTVNWNPEDDSILMSFIAYNTVVQIDRESGDLIAQYGDAKGSYAFDPDLWGFDFQHYPNITPEGTLMVSSHLPGLDKHAFMEFQIDRENEVLIEEWIYREGDEWADAMGEAHPIPDGDGNILANYGSDGVIKEITLGKETAWKVTFYGFDEGDLLKKMVGHCTLLDDLYAINRGPLN